MAQRPFRCLTHHIWHASCVDCRDQRRAEQQAAALERLREAAR